MIGLVAAGFMGSQIAESAALTGKDVVLYEPQEGPLERSRQDLAASACEVVSSGRLNQEEADRMIDRVVHTTRFEDLSGTDAVIEAVTEDATVEHLESLPAIRSATVRHGCAVYSE